MAPTAALGLSLWVGHAGLFDVQPSAPVVSSNAVAKASVQTVQAAATPRKDPLLAPSFSLGVAPRVLADSAPVEAAFQWTKTPGSDVAKLETSPSPPAANPVAPIPPVAALSPVAPADEEDMDVADVPLPVARPPELRALADANRPAPAAGRSSKLAAAASAPADDRSFIEKLFGVQRSTSGSGSGQAMAYAAPQDEQAAPPPRKSLFGAFSSPSVKPAEGTAVYDISAKTLYMPNGERIEAHSGLGEKRDDPRYVNVSMRGPTPPHVYDLSLREQLFHGVRALRLNPVGGSGAIHNRVGLLAHTFMLGPNGDSNGCVSIRDYDKFLQAYLNGQVKRLVVVASAN